VEAFWEGEEGEEGVEVRGERGAGGGVVPRRVVA